jgi:Tfp pilus assembly protein FimT
MFVARRSSNRALLPRRRAVSGMSLLELLLVVGLLATVAAISWPALRRPMNRSFVQTAAQDLQRDLLAARFEAMDRGSVRVFQFQPGTTQYWIGEKIQDDPREEETSLDTQTSSTDSISRATDDTESTVQNLPDGTYFQSPEMPRTKGADAANDLPSAKTTESASQEGRWSKPVRFYPSGRMDSAKLVIESDDGYVITIDIQGLAGRIRLADLQRISSEETDVSTDSDEQLPKKTRESLTTEPQKDEQ